MPLAAGTGEKNPAVRRRERVYPSPPRCARGGFIMDFPFSCALFGSSLSCQLEPASSPGTFHHSRAAPQTLAGATHKTQAHLDQLKATSDLGEDSSPWLANGLVEGLECNLGAFAPRWLCCPISAPQQPFCTKLGRCIPKPSWCFRVETALLFLWLLFYLEIFSPIQMRKEVLSFGCKNTVLLMQLTFKHPPHDGLV